MDKHSSVIEIIPQNPQEIGFINFFEDNDLVPEHSDVTAADVEVVLKQLEHVRRSNGNRVSLAKCLETLVFLSNVAGILITAKKITKATGVKTPRRVTQVLARASLLRFETIITDSDRLIGNIYGVPPIARVVAKLHRAGFIECDSASTKGFSIKEYVSVARTLSDSLSNKQTNDTREAPEQDLWRLLKTELELVFRNHKAVVAWNSHEADLRLELALLQPGWVAETLIPTITTGINPRDIETPVGFVRWKLQGLRGVTPPDLAARSETVALPSGPSSIARLPDYQPEPVHKASPGTALNNLREARSKLKRVG